MRFDQYAGHCIDIMNARGEGAVGGGGNPSVSPSMTTGAVPDSVDSTSVPLSSGHGNYLSTQSQASCRSASIGPLALCPFSGFDLDNEEVNVHANFDVAHGHANVHASNIMMTDNDMTIMPAKVIWMSISAPHSWPRLLLTLISLLVLSTLTSTSIALTFSLQFSPLPSLRLSSSFCCCWGAHLRSRSFQYCKLSLFQTSIHQESTPRIVCELQYFPAWIMS